MEDATNLRTFTLPDSGFTVHLRTVSPFALNDGNRIVDSKWAKEGRAIPTPPTYTITTGTGDTETHEHTYQTAQADAESRAAWEAYVDAAYQYTGEAGTAVMDIIAVLGVVEDPGDDWLDYCAGLDIPLPDKAAARKRQWVKTWVCRSSNDLEALTKEVARISGVDMDLAARAKETFRRQLEGRTD